MIGLLSCVLSFAGRPLDLDGTKVFYDGLAGVANYRIPAIVQAAPSAAHSAALVAFAEARHGGDSSTDRIAVRSSFDSGATWSNVTFAAGHMDTPQARQACATNRTSCRVGNPAAVYDAESGAVTLIYAIRGFDAGQDDLGNGMVKSTDGGKTWSAPVDVSTDFGAASGSMPGPGTALQLDAGSHAGRLLVVSHHGAYQHDYVSLSDDNGATWRTINQTFEAMDEAALTQLPNGSVLLNMRHQKSPSKGRGVALSLDGGDTFGPIHYDATLISPVCQASIVSFGGVTYFSNPTSTAGRNHLTIRRSTDRWVQRPHPAAVAHLRAQSVATVTVTASAIAIARSATA